MGSGEHKVRGSMAVLAFDNTLEARNTAHCIQGLWVLILCVCLQLEGVPEKTNWNTQAAQKQALLFPEPDAKAEHK